MVVLLLRVLLTDRSGQTGAVRYRYTGPVWPETGQYRSVPVDVKFEFKKLSSTGLYRYTSWFGRYTGDLKKFSSG